MKNAHGLTPQQEAFAVGIAAGLSQADAYRKAYPHARRWKDQSVWVKASQLAAVDTVQLRVRALLELAAENSQLTVDGMVRRARDVEEADARELCELRRICCRYCHGEGFRYQRTAAERERAYAAWESMPPKKRPPKFDELGGIGYHKHKRPNPDCPECFGEGVEEVFFKDTRNLSAKAVMLFTGVKVSEKGIEIKMRSQDAAQERLLRIVGAFEKDNRQKSDPLVSLLRELSGNVFEPAHGAGAPDAGGDAGDD